MVWVTVSFLFFAAAAAFGILLLIFFVFALATIFCLDIPICPAAIIKGIFNVVYALTFLLLIGAAVFFIALAIKEKDEEGQVIPHN